MTEQKISYEKCNQDRNLRGINRIIDSMRTESHGMYGDFGRYTWDSAFRSWNVDSKALSNLAIKMILKDYGYKASLHGEFDDSVCSGDRRQAQTERIGKKYQWIALHNLLAKVADNYPFENKYEDGILKYVGTFEPFVRDIDPTILQLQKSNENPINLQLNPSFWDEENSSWLRSEINLPNPIDFIERFEEGHIWLTLEQTIIFRHPLKIGEKPYRSGSKDFYYMLKAYIVKKNCRTKILNWAKIQNFMGRWMPKCHDCYQIFDKEYYWSSAYNSIYKEPSWQEVTENGRNIGNVALPVTHYFWENERDFSKGENVQSFYKPSRLLYDLMNLQSEINDCEYTNCNGSVVCKDFSICKNEKSALSVKKEDFLDALDQNGLDVFWTILGEKNIHTNNIELYPGRQIVSGVVYFEKGKLKCKLNYFE